MIRKRVRQFFEAGRTPSEADLALAETWLGPALLSLFLGQHPRDAAHSIAAARWLLERGHADKSLVRAALLHDVGKGSQRRVDRVAFVLASALRVHGYVAAPGSRFAIRRALARSLDHAERGASLLEVAGAGDRVVDLVRRHHSDPGGDAMLSLLEDADDAT